MKLLRKIYVELIYPRWTYFSDGRKTQKSFKINFQLGWKYIDNVTYRKRCDILRSRFQSRVIAQGSPFRYTFAKNKTKKSWK